MQYGRQLVNILGLTVVGVGGILAASGPAGIGAFAEAFADNVGFILIGLAIVALLHNLAPRGALIGPVVLAVPGLFILSFRLELWATGSTWHLIGIALAIGGGTLTMRPGERPAPAAPVLRIVGALFRRKLVLSSEYNAPERLAIAAFFGRVDVDLQRVPLPRYGPVEIMATCIFARVRITIPYHWPIVAGRVHSIRWTKLEGALDSVETYDDPQSDEQHRRLEELARERKELVGAAKAGSAVVLHVVGVGGSVAAAGR